MDEDQVHAGTRSVPASVLQMWTSSCGPSDPGSSKGALRVCAPVGPPSVLGISAQTSHIREDTQERRRLAHPSSAAGMRRPRSSGQGVLWTARCVRRRASQSRARKRRLRCCSRLLDDASGRADALSVDCPGPFRSCSIPPPSSRRRTPRVRVAIGLREDLWLVSCNRRLTLTESADENDDGYSGPLGGLIATHAWRYWRGFSTICNRRFASRGSGWPGSRRALYRHLWC